MAPCGRGMKTQSWLRSSACHSGMVESHLKDHPTLGTAWQTVPDGLVSKKKIEYLLYKDQAIVHPDLQYIQSAHTLTF